MVEPASEAPDPLEVAVEQAIAICDGDVTRGTASGARRQLVLDGRSGATHAGGLVRLRTRTDFAGSRSQREAGALARNISWKRGRHLTQGSSCEPEELPTQSTLRHRNDFVSRNVLTNTVMAGAEQWKGFAELQVIGKQQSSLELKPNRRRSLRSENITSTSTGSISCWL
jgi:hypothetical protein